MNTTIRELDPKPIWKNFADLNAVPRPSKKEERVIEFMKDFGENLGLETVVDAVGNVIIKKPATKGLEGRKTVVMQSHLDMVHQKNNDTDFDFDSQGIDMYVDGDWVRAKGTTLGADNGLGVATIMAILESSEIEHPSLEALFTIDEETGMTGAMELDPTILQGDILLNLDTEEDDEIGIGCAGGVDVTATKTYKRVTLENGKAFKLIVKGLQGGHSGMDIIKGLGNANVFMNRVLFEILKTIDVQLCSLSGGSLRNAIPRESVATFVINESDVDNLNIAFQETSKAIKLEYKSLEKDLQFNISEEVLPNKAMSKDETSQFVNTMYAAHNGVYRMSPDIEGLVETSNNIAKVTIGNGNIEVLCLTRSSVETSKQDLANKLKATFNLSGFDVNFSGEYPGWQPNPNSDILKVLDKTYKKLNNSEQAHIAACHAGLECGIIGSHYPDMDMISFGPTIRGAHSPDERVSISSVQKYWALVKEVLKQTP